MTLTLEAGPWLFDVNNSLTMGADSTTQVKNAMMTFKEIMINLGWSVVASSNSVSVKNVGDSSPDLWLSTSNIVFSTSGVRSWIIFYDSITTFYLFVHCNFTSNATVGYYYLGDIGTNGTTSALPTGTTTVFNTSSTYSIFSCYGATRTAYMHGMKPADGKGLRIITVARDVSSTGPTIAAGFLAIDKLIHVPSTFDGDVYFNTLDYTFGIGTQSAPAICPPIFSTLTTYPYSVCYKLVGQSRTVGSAFINYECYYTGSNTYPIVYISQAISSSLWGQRFEIFDLTNGGCGRPRDLWIGNLCHPSPITFPNNATYEFYKIGALIVPWAGVMPLDLW